MGIHGICLQDSPLGIRYGDHSSGFPAGINVGATWDRKLAYQRGKAMGEEFNDKGIDVQLGPAAGPLGRSPDAGRNWEGFAPDPALTGVLMAETVKGIQDAGVVATAKHFIANEQEHFRQVSEAKNYGFDISDTVSSNVDDKTMHEMYMWPFADAVRAGVGAFMCSYNQINNSYGCQNSYMLNNLLKHELGFQGFVMTDWAAHQSGVSSALAGLDMSMPGDITFDDGMSFFGTNLTIGVLNGTVPEWRVDDMAVRIMSAFYKVGRDKQRFPPNFSSWTTDEYGYAHFASKEGWKKVNDFVNVQRDHADVIRRIGQSSSVLLKNKGALPLTGDEGFVAILGEDAGANPKGPNGCEDRGCDDGTLAMAWGSGTAEMPYLVTPEQAIQHEILNRKVKHSVQSVTDNWALDQVASVASQASVSLVFVNADSGEGFLSVDGNEGDRNNLTLWKNGEELIKTATKHCKNTVVVMHTAGPVLVDEWYDNPNVTAIVWAGLPGQESGNAIADVLYGHVNPGGKSPFTWGKTRQDYGAEILREPNNGNGAPQVDFSEGVFIDYRYFDKMNTTPIYEFGFGLSYTTFDYANLHIRPLHARPYMPPQGKTKAAPTFGNVGKASDYLFPQGIRQVAKFIYPWLSSTDLKEASNDPEYGRDASEYLPKGVHDRSPQPRLPASGGPGGNWGLYDDLFEVSAVITNTGKVPGDEVPQLYVSLGGPNEPVVALRNFDRLHLGPGQHVVWKATLTRRDLSNWDTSAQNWVITKYPKTVFVGSSSRRLPLRATLPPLAQEPVGHVQ